MSPKIFTIAEKEHPGNGFGFDRVFILPDGRYVSELTPSISLISQRGGKVNSYFILLHIGAVNALPAGRDGEND